MTFASSCTEKERSSLKPGPDSARNCPTIDDGDSTLVGTRCPHPCSAADAQQRRGPGVGPGEGGGIGGGVYRVGGGVSAPIVIYRVEPIYSEEARKAKHQGVVVLWTVVRKDGSLEILRVVRSLGLGLDESAVNALRQWKFRPGTKDGVPVDVAVNVEVSFTLR